MSGVALSPDQPPASALAAKPTRRQQQASLGGIMGSLRLIELQLVAFIMVFSASGLVPLVDLLFPAVASAYILALSRFVFPTRRRPSPLEPRMFEGSLVFRVYVFVGTTVGLFLPLAYVLGGFARADEQAVRSATPHLFLLSFQILTENIISGLVLFSAPVRALVPLLYTIRRVFVLVDWVKDVWIDKTLPFNPPIQDVVWYWFGRGLAAANLGYFGLNLTCFLIPRFLPRAFESYFKEIDDETHAKMAQDKPHPTPDNNHLDDKKAD
ncbi:uncharacterized protein LOC127241378 [Andrographis paniculata]|uniref:uncharacterized protein LOC127241378 n=1 Tax=Andrographis paniculata TaxID=175694 RepID=UPI0021E6DD79|nr:uncharacterized protein LOC127241378 [Andrographis paniculata]